MFGTEKEAKKNEQSYKITVDAARATKNDSIIMIDLDVNGVKIKSCMLKEITVKEDGKKYKKGDKCYVVNFPSYQSGEKYYNHCWFPISNEGIEDIIRQVKSLL